MSVRQTLHGYPLDTVQSKESWVRFSPVVGYNILPQSVAPSGSAVSVENVVSYGPELLPRHGYTPFGGNNIIVAPVIGAGEYVSSVGTRYPVAASARTLAWISNSTWTGLSYATTGPHNDTWSGATNGNIWFANVYLPRIDDNILVASNGSDRLWTWGGPTSSLTTVSSLTNAPIAADVVSADRRVVVWNVQNPSTNSRFVNRLAWSVYNDPEDWVGVGSGYLDIVEAQGTGTRVFELAGGGLLAATDSQLWVISPAGPPRVFQYAPLSTTEGIPFPRAAVKVPEGVVWVDRDDNVKITDGQQITVLTPPDVRDRIGDTVGSRTSLSISYMGLTRQLMVNQDGTNGWIYGFDDKKWWPVRFGTHSITYGASFTSSNGARSQALYLSNGSGIQLATAGTNDRGTNRPTAIEMPVSYSQMDKVYCKEMRLSLRANSASSLSVALSMDGRRTWSYETKLSVSAASDTTQVILYPSLTGDAPAVRLRSDDSGEWRVGDIALRMVSRGRNV